MPLQALAVHAAAGLPLRQRGPHHHRPGPVPRGPQDCRHTVGTHHTLSLPQKLLDSRRQHWRTRESQENSHPRERPQVARFEGSKSPVYGLYEFKRQRQDEGEPNRGRVVERKRSTVHISRLH